MKFKQVFYNQKNRGYGRVALALLMVGLLLVGSGCQQVQSSGEDTNTANTTSVDAPLKSESNMAFDLEAFAEKVGDRISNERMRQTIALMSASDGGRIAGFDGEKETAQYLEGQFEDIGLEVSQGTFPCEAYVCTQSALQIMGTADIPIADYRVLSFSGATADGPLKAQIVNLGLGAEADYKGLDVKDKVVFIQRGGEFYRIKVARAAQNGAAAALFYDLNTESAVAATLGTLADIPAMSISSLDAQSILEALESGRDLAVQMLVSCDYKQSTSQNVVGILEATDPEVDKKIVIGAHYDGVDTPAANDNASGVAVVLELARAFVDQRPDLKADLVFVAFGAEEIGLLGSSAYIESLPAAERSHIVAMYNFDMVGVGTDIQVCTIDGQTQIPLATQTLDVFQELGGQATIEVSESSDHVPFAYSGLPAVFVQVGPVHTYHTDQDVIEGIDFDLMNRICTMGASAIMKFNLDLQN